MKSNLAYINEAAESAVCTARSQEKTSIIAGFRVNKRVEHDRVWSSSRETYRAAAKVLESRLKQIGVTPIAVLPTTWWHEMVNETGLLDLRPNQGGEVNLSTKGEAEKAERARYGMMIIGMLGLIGTAIIAQFLPSMNPWLYLPLAALMTVATFLLVAVLHDDDQRNPAAVLMSWARASLYVALNGGRDAAMRRMLSGESGHSFDRSVAIRLPEPPQDVAEVLEKAQNERLYVAAEPGAVGFAKSPAQIIAERMRKDNREANAERARLRALDPIIYIEQGPAVAIIAQFGEFPMEQALVRKVIDRQIVIG